MKRELMHFSLIRSVPLLGFLILTDAVDVAFAADQTAPAVKDSGSDSAVSTSQSQNQAILFKRGSPEAGARARLIDELVKMSKENPALAFVKIDTMTPENYATAIGLSKSDFTKVADLGPDAYQSYLRVSVASRLITEDFSRLSDVFQYITNKKEREDILATTVPSEYQKNPQKVLPTLSGSLTGDDLESALFQLSLKQAESGDIAAAMAARRLMAPSSLRTNVTANIAGHFPAQDFESALRWLAELPAGREHEAACFFLATTLSEKDDVEKLEQLLSVMSDGSQRRALIRRITSGLLGKGDAAVAKFSASLGPVDLEQVKLEKLAHQKSGSLREDITRAAAWENPNFRWEAIATVIEREDDLRQAAAIVISLPPDVRDVALSPLVVRWTERDAGATMDWIRALPEGPLKDQAAKSCAEILKYKNRSAAVEVAGLIGDADLRERITRGINPMQKKAANPK